MKKYLLRLLFSIMVMGICSCEKRLPVIPNESELITTVLLELSPTIGGDMVQFSWIDLDGDGGDAPIITTSPLSSNTTYSAQVTILNEYVIPPADIGAEVIEEGTEHQLFYLIDTGLELSIEYSDLDDNGLPIGISTSFTTGNTSGGNLRIVLRHEPNKLEDGVQEGLIENAGGETDIQIDFDVEIQ